MTMHACNTQKQAALCGSGQYLHAYTLVYAAMLQHNSSHRVQECASWGTPTKPRCKLECSYHQS